MAIKEMRSLNFGGPDTYVPVPTDWNQNDETQPDFLKNKPFGVEPSILVQEQTFIPNADGVILEYVEAPEIGAELEIKFDGQSYAYTAFDFLGIGTAAGNPGIMGFEDEDDGGPCIVAWANGGCQVMTNLLSVNHVIEVTGEKIKKLSSRYYEQGVTFYADESTGYLYKDPLLMSKVTRYDLIDVIARKNIIIDPRNPSDVLVSRGCFVPFCVDYDGAERATAFCFKSDGTIVQYYTSE